MIDLANWNLKIEKLFGAQNNWKMLKEQIRLLANKLKI